eukprot:jgi/Astpho2/59/Aster-04536
MEDFLSMAATTADANRTLITCSDGTEVLRRFIGPGLLPITKEVEHVIYSTHAGLYALAGLSTELASVKASQPATTFVHRTDDQGVLQSQNALAANAAAGSLHGSVDVIHKVLLHRTSVFPVFGVQGALYRQFMQATMASRGFEGADVMMRHFVLDPSALPLLSTFRQGDVVFQECKAIEFTVEDILLLELSKILTQQSGVFAMELTQVHEYPEGPGGAKVGITVVAQRSTSAATIGQTLALVMPRDLESSLGSIFDQHLAAAGLQVQRSSLISTIDLNNYTLCDQVATYLKTAPLNYSVAYRQQQAAGDNLGRQPLPVPKQPPSFGSSLQPSLLTLTDSLAEGLRKRTVGVPSLVSTSKSSLPGSVSSTPSPQASSQAGSQAASQPTKGCHPSSGAADGPPQASATVKLDIDPSELTLCRNDQGQPVLLGTGGFGRELNILQRACMQDQHIVKFFGVSQLFTVPVLVTECMGGGNLRRAIVSDQHGPELVWDKRGPHVALDVLKGLLHLHSINILHGDIKSLNVLLDTECMTAKLADVGLARLIDNTSTRTNSSHLHGWTLAYAAPEVLLNYRAGTEADMYSFGILLHELITGEGPKDCPQEIVALVESCLEVSPERRPTAQDAYQIISATLQRTNP